MLRACVLDFGGNCNQYLPKIIITNLPLICLYLKLCIARDVDPQSVGKKWETRDFLVQT